MSAHLEYVHAIPDAEKFGRWLLCLLDEASTVKATHDIEPPLTSSDFGDLKARFTELLGDVPLRERTRQYSITDIAAREIFLHLVAQTDISSHQFVRIWNLLDILSILCDNELCEPALVFWLVEELLDSQTIAGCRKIFDFLESRRERLTSKHFKMKHLVILRSCNELLRRLSRAEDSSFCGRVFIFLFQSFPLGDKSSVNLRGEYHVENVTAYDKNGGEDAGDKMDVDEAPDVPKDGQVNTATAAAASGAKGRDGKEGTDLETLYPIFWSLQDIFSQPKRLFEKDALEEFKKSLSITVKAMKAHASRKGSVQSRASEEHKQSLKRKAGEMEGGSKSELSNTFNPKYLTSRDLFELEISDISFQRHVLVQALIIMDFLISLSEPEKEKLAGLSKKNASVMYQEQALSKEDTQWAVEMRRTIQDFLIEGPEGAFFYRMVESILSRDKNWVRWKMESCPPIELPPMSPETFNKSKANIERITSKRPFLSAAQPGSISGGMDWSFLEPPDPATMWEKYEKPERWKLPDLKTYQKKIADAKFAVEMAATDEERAAAEEVLAAQTWRAMRIASTMNIARFDKVEDYRNVDFIFDDPYEIAKDAEAAAEDEASTGPKADPPQDPRVVVVSGPPGVGKTTLIRKLVETYPGVFKIVPRLTSRQPAEGETAADGIFEFVGKPEINVLMDRDQIIEFEDVGDDTYATSRPKIDSIVESGKVPVLRLPPDSAQSIKDWDYDARFVFVAPPPDPAELKDRLKKSDPGMPDEKMDDCVKKAKETTTAAREGSLFEAIILNGDLDVAVGELGTFVYGASGDVEMKDDGTGVEDEGQQPEESGAAAGEGDDEEK